MTVLEENAIDKSGRNVYVGGRWECIWKKLFIRENMPLRIVSSRRDKKREKKGGYYTCNPSTGTEFSERPMNVT